MSIWHYLWHFSLDKVSKSGDAARCYSGDGQKGLSLYTGFGLGCYKEWFFGSVKYVKKSILILLIRSD
jgi:hypothetical protein